MTKTDKKKALIEKMSKELNLNKKNVVKSTICTPEHPITTKL